MEGFNSLQHHQISVVAGQLVKDGAQATGGQFGGGAAANAAVAQVATPIITSSYASEAKFRAKEYMLAAVAKDGYALKCASADLGDDREVVLAAVAQNGYALQYASAVLKKDKGVVLAAVAQNGRALFYANAELRNDKEVVLPAIAQDSRAFEYASAELQNGKEFILEVVAQNGMALEFVSEDLKSDERIVLAAVAQNGMALEYASEDLQADKDVVLAAVAQNGKALEYTSAVLRNDSAFILEVAGLPDSNLIKQLELQNQFDKDLTFLEKANFNNCTIDELVEIATISSRYNYNSYPQGSYFKINKLIKLRVKSAPVNNFHSDALQNLVTDADPKKVIKLVQALKKSLDYEYVELNDSYDQFEMEAAERLFKPTEGAQAINQAKFAYKKLDIKSGDANYIEAAERLFKPTEGAQAISQKNFADEELKIKSGGANYCCGSISVAALVAKMTKQDKTIEGLLKEGVKRHRKLASGQMSNLSTVKMLEAVNSEISQKPCVKEDNESKRNLGIDRYEQFLDTIGPGSSGLLLVDAAFIMYASNNVDGSVEIFDSHGSSVSLIVGHTQPAYRAIFQNVKDAAAYLSVHRNLVSDCVLEFYPLDVTTCHETILARQKQQVLAEVAKDGNALQYASEGLQDDKEVVLAAVSQNGRALEFASDELKADRDEVLAAVSNDGLALQHASAELRADRGVVLAAVRQHGWALQSASAALKADRDVVLAAVGQDGEPLRFAADALREDREVVLAAVGRSGSALYYAADELKADREVVLAAVSNYGRALYYATDELLADRDVVLAAVSEDGRALRFAAPALQADPEIRAAARLSKRSSF